MRASYDVGDHFQGNKSAQKCAYSLPVFRVLSNHMYTMKTRNKPIKTAEESNQEKALQAFVYHVARARELVSVIESHLDEHMGVDSEEVNWANVGDANRTHEALKEIATTLNLILEPK